MQWCYRRFLNMHIFLIPLNRYFILPLLALGPGRQVHFSQRIPLHPSNPPPPLNASSAHPSDPSPLTPPPFQPSPSTPHSSLPPSTPSTSPPPRWRRGGVEGVKGWKGGGGTGGGVEGWWSLFFHNTMLNSTFIPSRSAPGAWPVLVLLKKCHHNFTASAIACLQR